MKLKELIEELQKIADQGEEWGNAEVERSGTEKENDEYGGPSEITSVVPCDFGDHQLVLIYTGRDTVD